MTTDPDRHHIAALLPGGDDFTCTALPGDAGNRRYFRVQQGAASYILMQLAGAEGFKQSEEAVSGGDAADDELPFLKVGRALAAANLPVPTVVATDLNEAAGRGLILLEDLGDTSLMAAIADAPATTVLSHYRQAIDHLVTLQTVAPIYPDRHYDAALFGWEFDHYLEYGIGALHDVALTDNDWQSARDLYGPIAHELAAGPAVLVHRDYHSRNLMVRPDGGLGLIDFQDALTGPATYDLASLLWDPYVTLPEGVAAELTDYYISIAPVTLPADFAAQLRRCALQRLLKAAGRFVYIDRVKGNPSFLADVPVCLARAGGILAADPALHGLRDWFGRWEPRLRTDTPGD